MKLAPTLARLSCVVAAAAAMTAPVWDATNGVYVGNRAAGSAGVPSPLWIFGYGSLCWKTEFPHAETCVGRVEGLTRYFAQRSQDHRGTPAAPGLVATVVRDEDLIKLGLQETGYAGSCVGTAYRVADADARQVLDDLDFREKGGYTREVVRVAHAGGALDALLYRGTVDNPNFDATAIQDLDAAAATIKDAVGPSGPNRDYLLNLATWLAEVGEEDEHVAQLVERVAFGGLGVG